MLFGVLKDDVMEYVKKRSKYATVVVILFFLILTARLVHLQIFKYDEYTRLSENNRIRIMEMQADRGFIKDRNGELIAKNSPGYVLEVTKGDVQDMGAMLDKLLNLVKFDKERVLKKINQTHMYESVKIARGITFEQISYLMEYSNEYSGIQLVADPTRSYTDGDIFCHILGYLGEASEKEVEENADYKSGDVIGKTGIEKEFDKVLRGKNGTRRVEVDSVGRVIEVIKEDPSIPGKNIVLTIDQRLQEYASDIIDGRMGSVVVLDMEDNSVLTMYSAPTYDLNMFSPFITDENWKKLLDDPQKPLLNRPIEGAYPPGSVYKVVVAAAALKEGIITPNTRITCNGSFRATAKTSIIHNCWKRSGHGSMDLKQALAESCDVYFYTVGSQLGIDKLYEYSAAFSLGRLTGISLPNEKTGVLPSQEWKKEVHNEPWYPGETVNISIGQGYMTTTPLQVAVMYSSLFNGGKFYTPRIVDAFEDPVTGEKAKLPVVLKNTKEIESSVLKPIIDGIVSAVEDRRGTSWRAKVPGMHVGGKTGTAQVVSMKRVENLKDDEIPEHWRDHSWFAGVFPSDKPRYVVVVMLEHGGSGGKSGAPVAGDMMKKMLELGYVTKD